MKKLTHTEFIEKLDKIHPNRGYIVIGKYINTYTNILVETKYGNCQITPNALLMGCKTSIITAVDKVEYLTKQLEDIFGKLPYTIVGEYKGNHCPIEVEDKYGICLIRPLVLLSGYNPGIRTALNKTEYIINKFKEIHGDRYSYENFIYVNDTYKSNITCKIHGDYKMNTHGHWNGNGCTECAYENKNGFGKEYYIKKANGRVCTFYTLRCFNEEEGFYKIGFTKNTIKRRFDSANSMPYNYEIISEIQGGAEFIWDLEFSEKKRLSEFKYIPLLKFQGYATECFTQYI